MTYKAPTGWQDRLIESMPPTIPLGGFIGRFQFPTLGHLGAILDGLTKVQNLAILVGSSNQPRTYFNPFTFEEREEMILGMLPESVRDRVRCFPLEDSTYNNTAWIIGVQERMEDARIEFGLPEDCRIGLVGHKKDGTSYYLNMFPQWEEVAVSNTTGLSATPLREKFFLTEETLNDTELAPSVRDWLLRFEVEQVEAFRRIREEYLHVQEYQRPYKDLPYPPIFVTVDACVVQSGHVLLVKRKALPGKGLWALPGGFLEASERIEDAVYRELKEETAIDVPEAILRGRTEEVRVFDAVHRSSRGRTITHCALINLQTPPRKSGERVRLPKIKVQATETERVKWWPLAGPGAIHPDVMFEDHWAVIQALTSKL